MSASETAEVEAGGYECVLADAIELAVQCHRNQFDKGGAPYILHPLRVMQNVNGYAAKIAAVLHDCVEDAGLELRLIRFRFGTTIADAVDALTRGENETYEAFIDRCAANPIARVVKLADLADNMDMRRLGREPTKTDVRRFAKYAKARATLLMVPE